MTVAVLADGAGREGAQAATRDLSEQSVAVGQEDPDRFAVFVSELRTVTEEQVSGLRAGVRGVPDAVTAEAELFEGAVARREVEAGRRFEGVATRVERRLRGIAKDGAGAERLRGEQLRRVGGRSARMVHAFGAWGSKADDPGEGLGEARRKAMAYRRGQAYDRTRWQGAGPAVREAAPSGWSS